MADTSSRPQPGPPSSSGGMFAGLGRCPQRLNIPPQPPLLTTDAVPAMLREVALLLDYLNRQPDSRLSRYFPEAGQSAPAQPNPPCRSYPYFLGRIAAIAALDPQKPMDRGAITVAALPIPAAGAALPQDDGAGESRHLGDLAFLIWTRDFLSSVAAPATLDTIRVTRAYRAQRSRGAVLEEDDVSRHTGDERDMFMAQYGLLIARRVKRFTLLAFILLWLSLYISYLVYSGQVLMHENATLQTAQAAHALRVKDAAALEEVLVQAALRAEQPTGKPLLARGYCDLRVPLPPDLLADAVRIAGAANADGATVTLGKAGESKSLRLYISDRQRELCAEQQRLEQRLIELRRFHQRWWDHAFLLRGITRPDEIMEFPGWVRDRVGDVWRGVKSNQSQPQWDLETFRYLMQQMINGLLASIMPAMYAGLGALASLLRRLAQKVETERLGPADYSGVLSSLVLGILTGAVIGLFTSALPQSGQTGLPLSTTALALLAGYATDRVFALFDNLAERVFVAAEPPAVRG